MDQLEQLFVSNTPLIDLRAEVEFAKGAFPSAVNIPILNDKEREAVGICYKEQGPEEAEKLGYELVSGQTRADRINQWAEFATNNPGAHLYCFRGGQRSRIANEWLSDKGIDVPRIEGGYKRMRNYLLNFLQSHFNVTPGKEQILIVAGRTGSGKTEFINAINGSLDLEGMARHRGSAFGKRTEPQPTQINFENHLAINLIQRTASTFAEQPMLVEDESKTIGRLSLPPALFSCMQAAPVLLLEDSIDTRVQRIYAEYVLDQFKEYFNCLQSEDLANTQLKDSLLQSLRAISRRLGGLATDNIRKLMEDAFISLPGEAHKKWIQALLENYYDPMYDYQIKKKSARIVYTGNRNSLVEMLRNGVAKSPSNTTAFSNTRRQ